LVVRARIDEVVSKSGHCRKLVTERRIKIRVAAAAIGRAMADANIGQVGGPIVADGNIARSIHHPIMDTAVPANDGLRIQITEPGRRLADSAFTRDGQWT